MDIEKQLYEALSDLLDDIRRERTGFGRGYEISHLIEEQAQNALEDYKRKQRQS